MNEALGYLHYLEEHLEKVVNPQSETIEQAAKLCEDSLKKDKRIYAFGSGHSAMVAEELCARAGGLAAMKPMVPDEVWAHNMPRKSTYLERIEGYGQALCRLYRIEKDDTVIVISNSGRNALPIDVASFAKECGAHVIAITSLKHSRSVSSRHSSGKKLYEIADVVLDNGADPGDAGYYAKGCPIPVGPTSSITGMALGQAMVAQIASDLYLQGKEIPIFKSSNLDGADGYNDALFDAYHNYWK